MRPQLLLTINWKSAVDFFTRGLHTRTAVARLPLCQLGFLVLYVSSACDLRVVIDSGLTTSDHVTADNLYVKLWQWDTDSETLCLTLTEFYKNYYNITSLLLTLKGPKGHTFPCTSPKSATAPHLKYVAALHLQNITVQTHNYSLILARITDTSDD